MIESSNGDNNGDEGVYREDANDDSEVVEADDREEDQERLKGLTMIKMPTRTVIVGNDKERLKYLDDDNDAVKGDDRGDDKERLKVLMTIMPTRAMIMRTMGLSKMLTMISMLKNNDDNVGESCETGVWEGK